MARENQGLQIALIVFVMLTIILGVTTYLFFRQYQEADTRALQARTEGANKEMAAQKSEAAANDLKRVIAGVNKDTAEALAAQFNEDMKKYGGAYPEEARYYHPLLERMDKTLRDRNDELQKAKTDLQTLKDEYAAREAGNQQQIAKFQAAADDAAKKHNEATQVFEKEGQRIRGEQAKIQADLVSARNKSKVEKDAADARATDIEGKLTALAKDFDQKSATLNKMTSETFDAPLGEVRSVNQHTGTAWINLGRADSLVRQVSFSVYPADITNLTTSAKKASIEVTQFVGDHLAEARVTDDRPDDPIMPGDKLYTPVWCPNQQRHFALTGVLDIDGDGHSDLATVMNLITMNGGVVDSYLDDKGEVRGHMTINTRYLVCGRSFEESGTDAQRKGYAAMTSAAGKLGVQTIPLQELLDRMGWKNPTPVVRYGRDLNPKDFEPKPEIVQKTSTGNVYKPPERSRPQNGKH